MEFFYKKEVTAKNVFTWSDNADVIKIDQIGIVRLVQVETDHLY